MAGNDKRANGSAKRANGSAADDAEFEKLLDEMDELGRQADALRAKVNLLIDEMRENDVPADKETDEETDEEANGVAVDKGSAADEEANGTATDEESGDIAVNGHDEAGHRSGEAQVEEEKENEAGDEDVAMDA